MADLTEILGDWSPSNQPQIDPPEIQLANAMRSAGLEPPTDIRLDGRLHRFASGTKGGSGHGDKSGWYVCFGFPIKFLKAPVLGFSITHHLGFAFSIMRWQCFTKNIPFS